MNERNLDEYDFDTDDQRVRVEYGGYAGVASIKRVGREALRWEIVMSTNTGLTICNMNGPEVLGEGRVIPSLADIENAQHVINEVIEQYIWDPMSTA